MEAGSPGVTGSGGLAAETTADETATDLTVFFLLVALVLENAVDIAVKVGSRRQIPALPVMVCAQRASVQLDLAQRVLNLC